MPKFTLRSDIPKPLSAIPIEVETLIPEKLGSLSISEIKKIPILWGNGFVPVSDLFQVSDCEYVEFEGDTFAVKRIGEGMTMGKITVHGSTGMHSGVKMKGGELEIHGDSGDWLGTEMIGGSIVVHGSTGHQVGAAYRGSRQGMKGGSILIKGDAGDEVGAHMRRGIIAVHGKTGSFTGVNMIAGTIAIGKTAGSRMAVGMKRGTIAIFGNEPDWPPCSRFACQYSPAYMGLLLNELRARFDWPNFEQIGSKPIMVDCHRSDVNCMGRGEILIVRR